METLYEILGIDKDAIKSAIKKAYFKLVKIHHPDKGGDPKEFHKIYTAYKILSDDKKRTLYDETGEIPKEEMNKNSKSLSLFINMVEKWINMRISGKTTESFEEYANKIIEQNYRTTEIQLKKAQKQKGEITKFKNYAIKMDNKTNIFEHVVLDLERKFQNEIHICNEVLDICESVKKEFLSYEYKVEEKQDVFNVFTEQMRHEETDKLFGKFYTT